MQNRFDRMPDDARLWVYALDRALTDAEREAVTELCNGFVNQWTSHGAQVEGAYAIYEDHFVLVAGYCPDGVSGCSTDSSVRMVKEIEQRIGVNAFDRTLVFFRNGGGKLVSVSRGDFQELVRQGHVTTDTPVFDATITTVGDLRAGRFETLFEKSWHAKAFG